MQPSRALCAAPSFVFANGKTTGSDLLSCDAVSFAAPALSPTQGALYRFGRVGNAAGTQQSHRFAHKAFVEFHRICPVTGLGAARLVDSAGERGLDSRRSVKGSQHYDAFDGREREFRGDVGGNARQSQHLNVKTLARGADRLEILPRKMLQPEHERTTSNRLLVFNATGKRSRDLPMRWTR
jgi:hypothetical protein